MRKQKENVNYSLEIKVFPNPANEYVTLQYEIPGKETGRFSLMSSTGKRVLEMELAPGKQTRSFSTRELTPGAYHFTFICNSSGVKNGKVIIVK